MASIFGEDFLKNQNRFGIVKIQNIIFQRNIRMKTFFEESRINLDFKEELRIAFCNVKADVEYFYNDEISFQVKVNYYPVVKVYIYIYITVISFLD